MTLKDINGECKTAVKQVCDPPRLITAATKYGLQHEGAALTKYTEEMQTKGDMITAVRCGFFIDTDKGYLGGGPDAIVTLANEDKGVVEITCPPTFRDKTVH